MTRSSPSALVTRGQRAVIKPQEPKTNEQNMTTTKSEKYNGWHNRATWNVALWLGNDEGLYRSAIELARAVKGRITSRDAEEICRELFPSGKTPDGDSLIDCRWSEIARDLAEMRG